MPYGARSAYGVPGTAETEILATLFVIGVAAAVGTAKGDNACRLPVRWHRGQRSTRGIRVRFRVIRDITGCDPRGRSAGCHTVRQSSGWPIVRAGAGNSSLHASGGTVAGAPPRTSPRPSCQLQSGAEQATDG